MSIYHGIMEGYFATGPGKFFDAAGSWGESVSRTLALGSFGAKLGQEICKMNGDTAQAAKCESVSNSLGAASGIVNLPRVIMPIERLVTGKMFWERNGDGTWVQTRIGHDGKADRTQDGQPVCGESYLRRDPVDVIQDIIALCARILSPINWLHGHNVYDLGKHARRISDSIMVLWGTFLALDIFQNIRKLCKEDYTVEDQDGRGPRARAKKYVAEIVCDAIDLASLPFDFGYGMNSTPALAITGVVLNIFSNAGYLIKEMAYYGSDITPSVSPLV